MILTNKISLQEKFNTIENYKQRLQLPKRKSGCIDLATGTGKSYVIYGIAQIALGLGIVDKVLVLGPPSTTIEKGLPFKAPPFLLEKVFLVLIISTNARNRYDMDLRFLIR